LFTEQLLFPLPLTVGGSMKTKMKFLFRGMSKVGLMIALIGAISAPAMAQSNRPFDLIRRLIRTIHQAAHPIAFVTTQSFLRDIQDGSSTTTQLSLNVVGIISSNFYRYKIGAQATTDCAVATGYSQPRVIARNIISDISALPDGDVVLCLQGLRVRNGQIINQQPLNRATAYRWEKIGSPGDTTPPGSFVIAGPSDTITTRMPVVSWSSAADSDFYDMVIALDGSCVNVVQSFPNLTTTSATVTTSLVDDIYFICVTARDVAGNTTEASNNGLSFTVDASAPAPFAIIGPSGLGHDRQPEITWESADGATFYDVAVSLQADCASPVRQGLNINGNLFVPASLPDGSYYICVVAKDLAGNTTTASNNGLNYMLDTVPPGDFTILAPTGVETSTNATAAWSASENAAIYRLVVATDAACSAPVLTMDNLVGTGTAVDALENGFYFTCMSAVDSAGNETPASNNGVPFEIRARVLLGQTVFVSSFIAGISTNADIPTDFPNFGGLEGADWNCNVAASQSGLLPNWNGTDLVWKAILSAPGVNAIDRFDIQGPVYNTINQVVATDKVDFWDGTHSATMRYDENGASVPTGTAGAWSGTVSTGTGTGTYCGGWIQQIGNGSIGNPTATGGTWAASASRSCANTARLYCISPAQP
jgi:hypothetical protein